MLARVTEDQCGDLARAYIAGALKDHSRASQRAILAAMRKSPDTRPVTALHDVR